MSQAQVTRLNELALTMTSIGTVAVCVTHTARVIIRLANDQILTGDDGDEVELTIVAQDGGRQSVRVTTNQITESMLRAMVHQAESMAREQFGPADEPRHVRQEQDTYLKVALWHDTTVRAMQTTREAVLPAIVDGVTRHGLRVAGFVGLMARAESVLTKEGISAFGEETDSEVTVTARSPGGTSSGWAGRAARDWSMIDVASLAEQASQLALKSVGAQALEPGRRTAILGPVAVAQVFSQFWKECNAFDADQGLSAFSKTPSGRNRLGQKMFDSRIQMSSDPADPDGGYVSYFSDGYATPKMQWVIDGVLTNLCYDPSYAMLHGKAYSDAPYSLRIGGGPSSIEAMIAQCQSGIYVNRFSGIELIDKVTGMMTGVTRDGCFYIEDGKISRPVRNFRFVESPFLFLNKLDALGATARAPLGYMPPSPIYSSTDFVWPLRPMIVPPMMVHDFNFSSLVDAV